MYWYPDDWENDPYAKCVECETEYDDEDELVITRGRVEYDNARECNVIYGICKECARNLAKNHGFYVSDEAARLYSDEGEKIANSAIPYLYTYDELMALVRKDIAERRLTGYMPDVKKIDDALYGFCMEDDAFFMECLEELKKGEKK